MKKLFALALCLLLTLSFWGCGKEPAPTEPATTPITTAPPEFSQETYDIALAALEQQPGQVLQTQVSCTMTAGGETYPEEYTRILSYTGRGTDDFVARAYHSGTFCEERNVYTWYYQDGAAYLKPSGADEVTFTQTMGQDDFLATIWPGALVDPALYGSHTTELQGRRAVTTFRDPVGPEHWLGEGITLQDATATVTLRGESLLTSTYEASYSQNGADYTLTITTELLETEEEAPERQDFGDAQEVESLEGVVLLARIQDMVNNTHTRTALITEKMEMRIQEEVIGSQEQETEPTGEAQPAEEVDWLYVYDKTTELYMSGTGEQFSCLIKYLEDESESGTDVDPEAEPYHWSHAQLIQNGKWMELYDSGTTTTHDEVYNFMAEEMFCRFITQNIPGPGDLQSLKVREEGDDLIFTMTAQLTMSQDMEYNLLSAVGAMMQEEFLDITMDEALGLSGIPLEIEVTAAKGTLYPSHITLKLTYYNYDIFGDFMEQNEMTYTGDLKLTIPSDTAQQVIEEAAQEYQAENG